MALLGPDDDVVARLGREPRRIAVARTLRRSVRREVLWNAGQTASDAT
ncbi:hypothetical protein [Cellulosimicrobium sp. NPDC055967]